jgi:hypothetical protein
LHRNSSEWRGRRAAGGDLRRHVRLVDIISANLSSDSRVAAISIVPPEALHDSQDAWTSAIAIALDVTLHLDEIVVEIIPFLFAPIFQHHNSHHKHPVTGIAAAMLKTIRTLVEALILGKGIASLPLPMIDQ